MTQIPEISILTPCWNALAYLQHAAQSVLQQDADCRDWEWLIADDASNDGSRAMIEDLAAADSRIIPIFLEKNLGPAGARQAALHKARGRFIAFLDADDCWLPGKLARQVAFMKRHGCALSYTATRRMSADGGHIYPFRPVPDSLSWRQLLGNTAIICSTVILDRDKIGPFEIRDSPVEDFSLWLSILRRGHVARGLNEDLGRYRIISGSRSSNRLYAAWRVWLVYRRVEHLSLPDAFVCFLRYAANTLSKRAFS